MVAPRSRSALYPGVKSAPHLNFEEIVALGRPVEALNEVDGKGPAMVVYTHSELKGTEFPNLAGGYRNKFRDTRAD